MQAGEVDMETERPPLAAYLHDHAEWIERSFVPLKVFPISATRYKLQFFRMGALGFELEPCFAIEIGNAGDDRLFFLESIDLPENQDLPYDVVCRSEFRLEELEPASEQPMTRVHWTLHLDITVQLPKFLRMLPRKRVQKVAEQVVNQVARRMCDRLTQNVCNDYFRSIGKTIA